MAAAARPATLKLAEDLIQRPSVTPVDAGCQALLGARLQRLGFGLEPMRFGAVDNLWARLGRQAPLLVFAGHTDVVPPGPREHWHSDPFDPTIRDGQLYGRGAADMKGSLAAMVVAVERFLATTPQPRGSLAFLLTSDEEGVALDGTRRVMETLSARGEHIDWCLVGEPSSDRRLGDIVKIGRRGSLHGRLRLLGTQGHVAYPQLAENPIHGIGALITRLAEERWDAGDEHFPATTLQISNIHGGTGADNVIPGTVELRFNLRFGTASGVQSLQQRVGDLVEQHLLNEQVRAHHCYDYELQWELSGKPFLTPAGELVSAVTDAVTQVLGYRPELSTAGGTSDGRFVAPSGAQVVELGPLNGSIHKVNERVSVSELEQLTDVYQALLTRMLS